jgi:hypothetical protein
MTEETGNGSTAGKGRSMYTFRLTEPQVTASVQREASGDLFIQMKPHAPCSEADMYRLMERMGFEEALPPLKS